MIVSLQNCQCGEALREKANFCPRCGRELRQPCPSCLQEGRMLARHVPTAWPWCSNRGDALYACRFCGRWLPAGTRQCPDPNCGDVVEPTYPQHTGRTPDNSNFAESWHWPTGWESQNPRYQPPRVDAWQVGDEVHAAFVAHGRLYAWAGNGLLAIAGLAAGPLGETDTEARPDGTAWRIGAGPALRPNPDIAPADRAAIAGGATVFAGLNDFWLLPLRAHGGGEEAHRLDIGIPSAQVGTPYWWAGWSRVGGEARLSFAAIPGAWQEFAPRFAAAPPEAALPAGTQIALRDDQAFWIGSDESLWRLDCPTGTVERATPPISGLRRIWIGADGPRTAREPGGDILLGLSTPTLHVAAREIGMGGGPLDAVLAAPDLLAAVGARIEAVDARSGEKMGVLKRSGRWISGLLAPAPDGGSRLLMLTEEAGATYLRMVWLATGREEIVWSASGIAPLGLLAAGESLYVVHTHGVVRLREAVS